MYVYSFIKKLEECSCLNAKNTKKSLQLETHMHHLEGNASTAGRLFTAQADGIFGLLRRAKWHVNT